MLGKLDKEQVEQVLHSEVIGRIGCSAEGQVYVVPITYAYDGRSIYGHSAEGMKVRMMRANPRVCFEVDHLDNLANWRSVIAWGIYEELHGEQAAKAMQILLDRLAPITTSETSQPSHALAGSASHHADVGSQPAVVYRINLTEKTGRFEKR